MFFNSIILNESYLIKWDYAKSIDFILQNHLISTILVHEMNSIEFAQVESWTFDVMSEYFFISMLFSILTRKLMQNRYNIHVSFCPKWISVLWNMVTMEVTIIF